MKRSSLARVLGAAAAGMLLLPVLATHSTAAAARLEVTASPIQTWTIVDDLPALPVANVDLSDGSDRSVAAGTPRPRQRDAGQPCSERYPKTRGAIVQGGQLRLR